MQILNISFVFIIGGFLGHGYCVPITSPSNGTGEAVPKAIMNSPLNAVLLELPGQNVGANSIISDKKSTGTKKEKALEKSSTFVEKFFSRIGVDPGRGKLFALPSRIKRQFEPQVHSGSPGSSQTAPVSQSLAQPLPPQTLKSVGGPQSSSGTIKVDDIATNITAPDAAITNSTIPESQGANEGLAEPIHLFGDTSVKGTEEFTIDGPFSYIEVSVGSTNLNGIKVRDLDGKETIIGIMQTNGTVKNSKIDISTQKIKDCYLEIGDKRLTGLHLSMASGSKLNATVKRTDHPLFKNRQYKKIKIGSGIIGRIKGTKTAKNINSLGIGMIGKIKTMQIVSAEYPEFKNKEFMSVPTDSSRRLVAGQQIIDNRNSTVQQSNTILLTDTVADTYAFNFALTGMIGQWVTIGASVEIPLLKKLSANGNINNQWSVSGTAGVTLSKFYSLSQGAMLPVQCPGQKYCIALVTFALYELETPVRGLIKAEIENGDSFYWYKKGTFKTSNAIDMRTEIKEFNTAPNN